MGWSFHVDDTQTRAEFFAELRKLCDAPSISYVDSRTVGSHLWALVKRHDTGETFIVLFLTAKGRGEGWGYKVIEDCAHPYYYDCPMSLIDRATSTSTNAQRWYAEVRKVHATKKLNAQLFKGIKQGDTFYCYDKPVTYLYPYRDSRTQFVGRTEDNKIYRYSSAKVQFTRNCSLPVQVSENTL